MNNEYEAMRAEIKRLHTVCRAKDETLKDCISTCNYLLSVARNQMTLKQKTYYEKSIEDFQRSIL